MEKRDVRRGLQLVTETLQREPNCAYHLVKRSILIRLQDENSPLTLEDAEADLLNAYQQDPKHLEALEELAHFYDAVFPDREKARHYAQLCRDMAARLISDMDEILAEDS